MALKAKHKDTEFGVGDTIRVVQTIKEDDKERKQTFEGMVIGIRGRGENKSFTVRRVGAQKVGVERIFPLQVPTVEEIEVVRKGTKGAKQAKLYFTRNKSKRDIEKIYSRSNKKEAAKKEKSKSKGNKKDSKSGKSKSTKVKTKKKGKAKSSKPKSKRASKKDKK